MTRKAGIRNTEQPLLPALKNAPKAAYDIFPSFPLGAGQIEIGWPALAGLLAIQRVVIVEGYSGVLWEPMRARLTEELARLGVRAAWHAAWDNLLPQQVIQEKTAGFVRVDDPVFGTRFAGGIEDFFDTAALRRRRPDPQADLNILYGSGASLAGWEGCLVYLDVPKNEIQYRARAGSATNLGIDKCEPPGDMYKRFYFVDWVVLNALKKALLPAIDFYVDEQRPEEPALIAGDNLRQGLERMSRNYFRVRPWFEPGIWGGHWCIERIPGLPQNVPNIAWSFECITPENGLIFESGGRLLEVSFDLLMYQASEAVLGACARRFQDDFPVRFNFLDTVRGGELAIQCHPGLAYIRSQFGETFTQDESYYILDCEPGSRVWLGFQEDIDADQFRAALEKSIRDQTPVDMERFVQVRQTRRHEYYLLPNQTVHAAGFNNLVLEISATPYIFTFKLYDWLEKDLNGELRQMQLEHGFKNLDFSRRGEQVEAELVSRTEVIEKGAGWQLVRLPTHPEHFFEVYRFEFERQFEWESGDSFNLMNLVEGQTVRLETQDGYRQRFHWAETFCVPAAAGKYTLVNEAPGTAYVVMARMKKEHS
jgi:mannose-6-phosphate isomerase class I